MVEGRTLLEVGDETGVKDLANIQTDGILLVFVYDSFLLVNIFRRRLRNGVSNVLFNMMSASAGLAKGPVRVPRCRSTASGRPSAYRIGRMYGVLRLNYELRGLGGHKPFADGQL